jgi:porin
VVIGLEYTADVLANVDGGTRTGTIYQGKLNAILSIDFGKLVGLDGLSLGANGFQIHNTGRIRRDLVGGVNTIAAIEAVPTTRLSEIWFEQSFARGSASLRVGQLTADSEFFYSDLSLMFLQSDWPTIAALNLPSGGAAYPLSTPGIRLMLKPAEKLTVLVALLNGDPAGPGDGDEQVRNPSGLNFRLGDVPFLIAEAQLRWNQGKTDTGLATTLKLGGWHHFGTFDDTRFDADGRSLADPASSGVAAQRQGTSGLYAVLDQQLWRPAGGDAQSGVSVFAIASISRSDRSTIDRYVSGGIVAAGLLPGRPDDRFGASVVHARYSDGIVGFDRDQTFFNGAPQTIRDHETNLELTYRAQIVPGWTVQPTLQYVWHPSGDRTKNAVVVGARSLWRY